MVSGGFSLAVPCVPPFGAKPVQEQGNPQVVCGGFSLGKGVPWAVVRIPSKGKAREPVWCGGGVSLGKGPGSNDFPVPWVPGSLVRQGNQPEFWGKLIVCTIL